VADRLKKDVASIESWESGDAVPTYVQLERLAYELYKRPLALFFFPDPPEEADPRHSFRTLPEFERERLSASSRHLLRRARAMQIALAELNDGVNPCSARIFDDITITQDASVVRVTAEVREYLGVSLEEQARWRNGDEALKNWRARVEDKGVFVFKDPFKQENISGFSLLHEQFPVIYLNNRTAKTRQIFSLFHELFHLLQGTSGIAKTDDAYMDLLQGEARRTEVLCNLLAGEFLVPSHDFRRFLSEDFHDEGVVQSIASEYSVSREVVLRKALSEELIDRGYYERKAAEWTEQYKARRGSGSGGNYYANQAAYLGERFLSLAFGRYYQGRCTAEQLADYLGVRARNLAGLEPFALRREAP